MNNFDSERTTSINNIYIMMLGYLGFDAGVLSMGI